MLLALAVAFGLTSPCSTTQAEASVLAPSYASSRVAGLFYNTKAIPKPVGDLVIEGEVRYSFPILVARTVTFKPGARLILDMPRESGTTFVLIAHSIDSDSGEPGVITWNPASPGTDRQLGWDTSYSKSAGNDFGAIGSAGASGRDGNTGLPGSPPPSITIITEEIRRLPSFVLCGQDGERGSAGQPGNAGAKGATGESASQNAFNCTRGAGNGGPGGPGGNGGRGGRGGQGADGGSLTILIAQQPKGRPRFDLIAHMMGGKGGLGGPGAPGGPGGEGGEGGAEQLPWCRGSGSKGQAGSRGTEGSEGTQGEDGKPGTATFGFIDPKQLKYLLQDDK